MKKTKGLISLLLSIVMMFTIFGGASTSYADTITNVTVPVKYEQTMARSMLSMINSFRGSSDAWYYDANNSKVYCKNLSMLQYDYDLERVAMQRAAEIALTFAHTRTDGTSWYTVYDDYGLTTITTMGENLAGGYSTAQSVYTALREDDQKYAGQGHRRNMLSSNFNYVGIACVKVNDTYYWVQEFAGSSANTTKTTAVDSTRNVTVRVADSMVDKCTLTYSNDPINLISGKSASLPTATVQLTLKDFFSSWGVTGVKVTASPTYKSSNTSIATVSGNKVTAKAVGKTSVTANLFGKAISITVTSSQLNPTQITSVSPVANGFTMNWTKVSNTTGYQVQYATKSDFSNAATVYGGPTNTLSTTITGRAAGTLYYVRVRTYITFADGSRVWGDWSAAKNVTTPAKPGTTSIKSISTVANGFTINWTKVSDTTGYQLQYATKSDFSNAATVYGGPTNTLSTTITGRAAGTKYYVRVRTYKNINGNYVWGNWTSAMSVTTPAKPSATSITSVTGVANGFTIKWTKVNETTGYQIQYATKSDFSNAATIYGGPTNTTSNTITGRAANTTYYVRVRTYKNINGSYVWGNWSAAKTVKTK